MSDEIKEGWRCPVCKKVLAPTVKMCKKCSSNESAEADGTQLLQE